MSRRAPILAISSLLAVGVLVGGGYVVNAATAPSTTITACSHKKTGAVRIVAAKAKCAKNEKRVTWNVKGVAGADADADPNPNNLTYWMAIGNDPVVQVSGFTQKISQSGTTHAGGGGGAGKVTFGDIVMTLPMNRFVMNQMSALAKGTHIPAARLDMCKPGERDPRSQTFGKCTLSLDLSEVLVTGVDVHQDPKQAAVTVSLNFAEEKISILRGSAEATTYEWDIAGNDELSSTGSTLATATGDTTYTTTLTGADEPLGVLSTRSWRQSSSQSGTMHTGGGGGAGKANFADIVAETRTGHGTVALLRALATGQHLSRVELAGCETSTCTSTAVLSNVIVTELVLGSPELFDQVKFNYATIKWDRNDDPRIRPSQGKSFFWNVAENMG